MINSSRYRLRLELEAFAAEVPRGARVLDAGAAEGPYRDLFKRARYESTDHKAWEGGAGRTTFVSDLSAIPVRDDVYDFVVLTQVLEHVPDPIPVLRELRRVLKPGGRMIYSAPLFYEEHEAPFDFFRYTRFGAAHVLESAGFRIERLDWLEGYYGTVAYQLDTMARYLPAQPSSIAPGVAGVVGTPLLVLLKGLFRPLARMFHRLEMRTKHVRTGYPKNYVAVVSKPIP